MRRLLTPGVPSDDDGVRPEGADAPTLEDERDGTTRCVTGVWAACEISTKHMKPDNRYTFFTYDLDSSRACACAGLGWDRGICDMFGD